MSWVFLLGVSEVHYFDYVNVSVERHLHPPNVDLREHDTVAAFMWSADDRNLIAFDERGLVGVDVEVRISPGGPFTVDLREGLRILGACRPTLPCHREGEPAT